MTDYCCKGKRHGPAEIQYKGKWWCLDCWDKETEKDMKKQKEIRVVK